MNTSFYPRSMTQVPRLKQDTTVTLTMYSKPEIGVQYTVAKHGKMNVRKIG